MAPVFHSHDDRETTAAGVLLDSIDIRDGSILVAHDSSGRVARELIKRGCQVDPWWRMQQGGCAATPWPSGGPYDAATLRLSKDKGAFEMALHAIASRIRPGGNIWVYGANDEGIKSAPKRLSTVCDSVSTVGTKRHCRVLEGQTPSSPQSLRENLSDWRQTVTLNFSTGPISQHSYPGVFAKGKLDPGTAFLLTRLPTPKPNSTILDYACGSGVIAQGLLAVEPSVNVTLIDADAIAIEAAKRNVPAGRALVGYDLTTLNRDDTFDLIVANPPYHQGKERSDTVVMSLIEQSPHHLSADGDLWLVLQRQVNIRKALNQVFSSVNCTNEGAYNVWHARSPHP